MNDNQKGRSNDISTWQQIMQTRTLRVGVPGDYLPFAMRYKPSDTSSTTSPSEYYYYGHDIDLINNFVAKLNTMFIVENDQCESKDPIKIVFVHTSWPKLTIDLLSRRYDVAIGGITRIASRLYPLVKDGNIISENIMVSDSHLPSSPMMRQSDVINNNDIPTGPKLNHNNNDDDDNNNDNNKNKNTNDINNSSLHHLNNDNYSSLSTEPLTTRLNINMFGRYVPFQKVALIHKDNWDRFTTTKSSNIHKPIHQTELNSEYLQVGLGEKLHHTHESTDLTLCPINKSPFEPVVNKKDQCDYPDHFLSIKNNINQSDVHIVKNPGGTNEAFVLVHFPNAIITNHIVNEEIPVMVATKYVFNINPPQENDIQNDMNNNLSVHSEKITKQGDGHCKPRQDDGHCEPGQEDSHPEHHHTRRTNFVLSTHKDQDDAQLLLEKDPNSNNIIPHLDTTTTRPKPPVDVMITDTPEAMYYMKKYPMLRCICSFGDEVMDQVYENGILYYYNPLIDSEFINIMNNVWNEIVKDGCLEDLEKKYLQ